MPKKIICFLCTGNSSRSQMDHCPMLPLQVKREHWGFPDPAQATGTMEEKMTVFRTVRDRIETRIKQFAAEKV